MFGHIEETYLKKSWFSDRVFNLALLQPVIDSQIILGQFATNEEVIRNSRKELEAIFNSWKVEFGNFPEDLYYKGRSIDECPPYACSSIDVNNYADLLRKLRYEGYPPLLAMDYKMGYQCVSAILVLSEAAESRVESTIKAYLEIQRYQRELELIQNETNRIIHESSLRFIDIGVKSVVGYKNRPEWQDKIDCQTIAKKLWEKNPNMTIAAIERTPELNPYKEKYSGRETLRNWISQVDIRPSSEKTGRPKKN
ncbi:hypothetical protein SAMN06296273_1842 [Nitrosomonas ureae]|uniref:Uncharacterized protein n=1 Tax=Nitrosomonas ureae TaxID=44577 RepID=A0A285BYT0_9PROT|nr:hypothetical protein [Nitrosomonas ureae]SNX60380.1 hypothetical protein SAMN06296273_1842 [Nitrosomonas ureae]